MNHRTTSLSPAAQFKTHLPTFKNKSTKSHKAGFKFTSHFHWLFNSRATIWLAQTANQWAPFWNLIKTCVNCGTTNTTLWLEISKIYCRHPSKGLLLNNLILITIWQGILLSFYWFLTTSFEISQKRKFKAAEEVKSKRPDKNVDDSRPDMKGKIGCNACCLYWALHGVSFSDSNDYFSPQLIAIEQRIKDSVRRFPNWYPVQIWLGSWVKVICLILRVDILMWSGDNDPTSLWKPLW